MTEIKNNNIDKTLDLIEQLHKDTLSLRDISKSIDIEISTKKSNLVIVTKEVTRLTEVKRDLSVLDVKKMEMIEEIRLLNEDCNKGRDELNNINSQKSILNEEILRERNIKLKELKEIEANILKQQNIVLPKMSELNDREKKIAIKERDLRVIADRYKLLFGEHGVGFMI